MTFTLTVNASAWRAQQDALVAGEPLVVPVIKGNGYGFGAERLANEAARMGVDAVAAVTAAEVSQVRSGFDGDVLVLSPWHPAYTGADRLADQAPNVIRTLAHAEAVVELAQREGGARVVVEVLSPVRRHGVSPSDLPLLMRPLEALTVEGFALHLPLERREKGDGVKEVSHWAGLLADAGLNPKTLWVSHLSELELAQCRAFLPGATIRPRIGTDLWLGDRSTFKAHGAVLDLHPVKRGERSGYRQRRAGRDGTILIVSGGTHHGVGLESPSVVKGIAGRGRAVARGGLEAAGMAPSPFRLDGKRLWFVEPPHMQVSMLWVPADTPLPQIGDSVNCRVRMTTATFDEVIGL